MPPPASCPGARRARFRGADPRRGGPQARGVGNWTLLARVLTALPYLALRLRVAPPGEVAAELEEAAAAARAALDARPRDERRLQAYACFMRSFAEEGQADAGPAPPPPRPYYLDTSRPSSRTNRTRLVPPQADPGARDAPDAAAAEAGWGLLGAALRHAGAGLRADVPAGSWPAGSASGRRHGAGHEQELAWAMSDQPGAACVLCVGGALEEEAAAAAAGEDPQEDSAAWERGAHAAGALEVAQDAADLVARAAEAVREAEAAELAAERAARGAGGGDAALPHALALVEATAVPRASHTRCGPFFFLSLTTASPAGRPRRLAHGSPRGAGCRPRAGRGSRAPRRAGRTTRDRRTPRGAARPP
jgi:hypothetical protein